METAANKWSVYNFQSTPHWIDHLLPRLQAGNGETAIAGGNFALAQSVINILLSAVAKYDAKFSFQPVDSSSFFTEKEPNHFELLIFISSNSLRSAEINLKEDGCVPGLTLIEMIGNTHTQSNWKSLCRKSKSGKEYLSSKMMRSELSKLLSKLLTDMLYLQHYHDKTTQGVKVRNISSEDVSLEIKIRDLTLIVDLVVGIDCEGLRPVNRHSSGGAEKAASKSKGKTVNCGIQLVSKATSLEYHWRIWFCKAERFELNFNQFPQRKKCFQLLKSFVHNELDCDFLKPYHLQTLLLHESAKYCDASQWSIQTLPLRFYGLVNLLESFARDKFCPHFFTPSVNLFTEVSSHNLRVLFQKIKFLKDAQSLRVEENTWL